MLLDIDESVIEYWIGLLKDGLGSEREKVVIAMCLEGGALSDKKALYESGMSCGRNKFSRRVFFLSREISGCAIDLVDGTQCKH